MPTQSGRDGCVGVPAQITTIIPTFMRPQLLGRAIRSVLGQSYPHFEVNVYDNASGDETPQVAAQFAERDSRVKYHCHPQNIGLVQNIAFGIERVATSFVNILSDDDIVLPGFFESAIRALEDHSEAAMYMGATIDAESSGAVADVPAHRYRHGLLQPPEVLFEILRKGHMNWNGFVMRREGLHLIGGLDDQVGVIVDVDLQLRIAAQYPIVVSPLPAAVFFSHPGQSSSPVSGRAIDDVFLPWNRILQKLVMICTLDEHQRRLATDMFMARLRRRILRAGGEAAALGLYSEGLRAAQILNQELHGVFPSFCLRTLCAISQVIPAPVVRLLTIALEQTQRVFQKRRYGLRPRLPQRDRKPYSILVSESLARLGSGNAIS
jgi:glycosyl transferase family 2